MSGLAVCVYVLVIVGAVSAIEPAMAADLSVSDLAHRCEAPSRDDYMGITDAPTRVTETRVVSSTGELSGNLRDVGLDDLIAGSAGARGNVNDPYYGLYRFTPDHMIGINRFATDDGRSWVLISDYQSGVVRRLFPVAEGEFEMGPGFAVQSPAEGRVRFSRDASGNVMGISLVPTNGTPSFAKRVPLSEQEVTIADGRVNLAGTLMIPEAKGLRPAIILLHGSGPLTRYSFGPYPHFFTSLGLAVLIYDKRGTGASTGTRVDAVTGPQPTLPAVQPAEYYTDSLADDALAAFRFLQSRQEINSKEIGFWGSSEGGMLATQVAARNKEVAFAIDSSGYMGPLWQTERYQTGAILRGLGLPQTEINEAVAYTDLWIRVGRTGDDYERLVKERQEAERAKKRWLSLVPDYTSLEQLRWDWDHVFSFDPLPALKRVTCPVLGLWGELDESTDAANAAENMRTVLSEAGNRDVTVKIFPNANHPLMVDMSSASRMAPGVFETLRTWVLQRVDPP